MKKCRFLTLILLLSLITATFYYSDNIDIDAIRRIVNTSGIIAPFVFALVYVIATVLIFPVSLLTLLSGALFGPIYGTIYSLLSATIGATLALLISRYIASDFVRNHSGKLLAKIIDGVNQEGWQFVAFIRLVPLFPFNIINYAFGLTRIKTSHYFITSFICMFPAALAYTYIGHLGSAAAAGNSEGLIKKIIIGLSLLAIVTFIPKWVIKYRKNKGKQYD